VLTLFERYNRVNRSTDRGMRGESSRKLSSVFIIAVALQFVEHQFVEHRISWRKLPVVACFRGFPTAFYGVLS
jgi:hypothetical protein